MSDEVLIALGALVIGGLSYFAGVYRTKRHLDASASEARINHVVDTYVALVQASKTSGGDGLQKAGVATLTTDREVRSACARIAQHGIHSPLAGIDQQLEGVDLAVFFSIAAQRRHNFFSGNLRQLIADAKAQMAGPL